MAEKKVEVQIKYFPCPGCATPTSYNLGYSRRLSSYKMNEQCRAGHKKNIAGCCYGRSGDLADISKSKINKDYENERY